MTTCPNCGSRVAPTITSTPGSAMLCTDTPSIEAVGAAALADDMMES